MTTDTALISSTNATSPVSRPIKPVKLRHISDASVTFGNAVRAALAVDLSSLEPGTVMEVHAEIADSTTQSGQPVVLTGPVGRLMLEDGAAFLHALTGIPLHASVETAQKKWLLQTAAALLPHPLSLLFSQVHLPPAAKVGLASQHLPDFQLLMEGESSAPTSRPGGIFLRALLVLRTADHVVTTHAWATWSAWQQILAICRPQRPAAPMLHRWADLPSTTHVLAAQHVLGADRLRTMSRGDIVIPEQPLFDVTGRGSLRLGGWVITVHNHSGLDLEVVDVYSSAAVENDENSVPSTHHLDPSNQDADDAELEALHDLPVQVQFEMGSLSLSLNQLQSLAPGSVLRMQSVAAPPIVSIRAGARLLGKGELVDVDGQLGVQITAWTSR